MGVGSEQEDNNPSGTYSRETESQTPATGYYT